MPEDAIDVRGARVNNLKNISFSIPINQLRVVTGVSGSGKSSLASDALYAEGQRRYVESLSAYARKFLERMDKPMLTRYAELLRRSRFGKRIPHATRARPSARK